VDTTRVPLFDKITAIAEESALYYEMGQMEAAAEGYKDAIRLLGKLPRPVHLAEYLQGLALAQIRLRQFDEAEANLTPAGEIWQKHGSPYELANYWFAYGILEAWRGNSALALDFLRDALARTEQIEQAVSRDHLRRLIQEFMGQVESGDLRDEHPLG
jgi:tetratricopeptide (TPR) repeat protein